MDRFVRVYSGGELVKGPNGVEFDNLPEEGIWFEKAPTFSDLIDAVHKKLGWQSETHSIRAQGRMNVGGGAHRHFIMVPINDDLSWSSYVKAVFNGTEWNCLEIFVQGETRSSEEGNSLEPALMAFEPASVQNAQPQYPEQGSCPTPSVATISPNHHSRLQKPRKSNRTCANNGGWLVGPEVQSGQDQNGALETVGTTSYSLIGMYDADHRARALASGQNLSELNPRTREPLRFDKRYERYLRPAGLMGLVNICKAGLPSIDRALVSALVDRWRPETHTFHMPCGEVTITLQDVAMILGLPVAGHAVTVNPTESQNELVERYLGRTPPSLDRPRPGLRVSWVRAEFNRCPEDADEETVKQYARAYILSLISGVLFPDASGDLYTFYPFPLIADLENIGSYSWGSATLAYLYRSMCAACRRQSDQSNLTGCLLLLQLWSWERFPIGRPDMVKLKYPNIEELEDERDRPTVGLRWVVGMCTRRAAPARCYEHFTNEFDLLTDDQIVWCPYSEERVKELQLAPICTQDSNIWLTQAPLIYFFMVEVYTPERVMRQFGLHQVCPPPLRDTGVELHWCRRGRVHNDWAQKHKSFVDMWEANEQHVIMEERPYSHANYMDYLRWYRRSTRIRLCTPRRISNGYKDGTPGGGASADSEDPSRASQLRYTPRAHLIHSVTDKLTVLTKDAAAQKGCSRGECLAFVERVTRACVEIIGELGGSSLCDIADVIPFSSITATATAEPEVVNQRGMEEEINNSIVPDLDTEAPPPNWRSSLKAHMVTNKPKEQPCQGYHARGKGVDLVQDDYYLSCRQEGVKFVSNWESEMSIEYEAADSSQATRTLFEASEIKVVKLVLGTTKIILTTPEHEDESRTLNICVWHEGSAHQQQPTGVAAVDSVTSSGSQVEPVDMEKMSKEEFVEKLRGWIMVLASLFASMTFQAGLNPPKQFEADLIMERGAGNSIQRVYQGRMFLILNSLVFAYSLGLVMLMLFQPSLSVERLLGKRGFLSKSKRGLLCSNIVMLLLVFMLGSVSHWYDMLLAPCYFAFLVCTMYFENIRGKFEGWWKKLREKF